MVMLRIENLLLRGDGHGNPGHNQGRMLEETSLVQQSPRAVENGAASAAAAAAAAAAAVAATGGAAAPGVGSAVHPGAANGVHHEMGLGASVALPSHTALRSFTRHLRVRVDSFVCLPACRGGE